MNKIDLRVVTDDLITSMKLSERSHDWLEEIASVMVQTIAEAERNPSAALARLKRFAELSRFLAADAANLMGCSREVFEREQRPAIVAALGGAPHGN